MKGLDMRKQARIIAAACLTAIITMAAATETADRVLWRTQGTMGSDIYTVMPKIMSPKVIPGMIKKNTDTDERYGNGYYFHYDRSLPCPPNALCPETVKNPPQQEPCPKPLPCPPNALCPETVKNPLQQKPCPEPLPCPPNALCPEH